MLKHLVSIFFLIGMYTKNVDATLSVTSRRDVSLYIHKTHTTPQRTPQIIKSSNPPHTTHDTHKTHKKCSFLDIGCDLKKAENMVKKVEHKVENVVKKDIKKVENVVKSDLKKVENVVKKDIKYIQKDVQKVQKVVKWVGQAVMFQRDVQYAVKLLRKGKDLADDAWLKSKGATKALSHTLHAIGKVANVVSIAAKDIGECLTCSPGCMACRVCVDELVNMGENVACKVAVPAVCETIGLGPEDPLSEVCAVGMSIVCSKLEDKLETYLEHDHTPHDMCKSIKACKK